MMATTAAPIVTASPLFAPSMLLTITKGHCVIMATDSEIPHCTKTTQERIFRIAQRQGLTLKAISLDSGIPYSTLRGYAGNNGETAEMPVSALCKLAGV